MAGLASIEVGLIISIWRLRNSMEKFHNKAQVMNEKIEGINWGIQSISETFKRLINGRLKVKGKLPIGPVDVELELNRKDKGA